MKRIAIVVALLLGIGITYAQKGKVSSAISLAEEGKLVEAMETIKPALEHEKTKDWPKTYYALGRIYYAIALSTKPEDKAIFNGDALMEAYKMYRKANEMDQKAVKKETDIQYISMQGQFVNRAVERWEANKFDEALTAFETSLEISQQPIFNNSVDSIIIFNAGLAAYNAKNFEKAEKYFNRCIDIKYNKHTPYVYLSATLKEKGDTTGALTVLQKGFSAYPGEKDIIENLINHYLLTGEGEKSLEYIALAKQKDPKNASYYFAEGTVYERLGKEDDAINAYLRGIELDPNNFNCHYYLAIVYFNRGVKLSENAAKETSDKKYNELITLADEEFKRSLPYMEKTNEINPTEKSVVETLKTLYYRLKMDDKYNVTVEKLKNM